MLDKSQLNFVETINHIKESALYDVVCHNIGKIISFNYENQTAEIELMQLKQYNNVYYKPTVLSEIPVIIYGGLSSYITMPDLVGTICVILTFDRNIDAFLETGESYAPVTSRAHNITDSVALPTFYPFNKSIKNYDNEAITLYNEKIDEEGNKTSAHIKITDKLNLQNTTQNLANLIQAFLIACENIQTVTNTGLLTANSKKAFTDLKTQFEELLK